MVSEQGQRARGLYITAPMAHKLGARGVINLVRGAGFDAAVIDIKDGQGRISFDTAIDELAGSEHIFLKDAAGFVGELRAAGIYTIARIVCFSDPVLPREYPDRAILDNRPGHVGDLWEKNAHRNTWLDPYNEKNHELLVALARAVEAVGFQEIQLDYVRFPVDVATKFAVFPAQTETPRPAVLLGLLRRIDEAVHIPLGVDVFGVTAFHQGDPDGLGQLIDEWAKHVEVFSPMLYVHGMAKWMRQVKDGRAGLLVEEGVKLMRRRLGPTPVIRPFLQGFPSRADYYNPEFIAEQIRGARAGGADGVLFWNPMSSYGMVREGALGPARSVMPFPNEERRHAREGAWGGARGEPPTIAHEARPDKPKGCRAVEKSAQSERARRKHRRNTRVFRAFFGRTKAAMSHFSTALEPVSSRSSPAVTLVERRQALHTLCALVAAFGVEPGGQNLLGHVVGEGPVGEAEHVGVVPDPRRGSLARVAAQGRSDASQLVGGDADPRARPAEEDALLAGAARDGLGRLFCDVRPRFVVTALHRSKGHHRVPAVGQKAAYGRMNRVGFVGTECDAHGVQHSIARALLCSRPAATRSPFGAPAGADRRATRRATRHK